MELRDVWNSGVFGIEPRGFWCGTEGFLCATKSCVELGGFGTEKEWSSCVEVKC